MQDGGTMWDGGVGEDPANLSRVHAYGYVADEAYCQLRTLGCLGLTTSRCHGVAACIQCLTTHGDDVRKAGGKFEYVGSLEDRDAVR